MNMIVAEDNPEYDDVPQLDDIQDAIASLRDTQTVDWK